MLKGEKKMTASHSYFHDRMHAYPVKPITFNISPPSGRVLNQLYLVSLGCIEEGNDRTG